MKTKFANGDIFGLLKKFSKADIFARPASSVVQGALRLEAGFYGSDGYRALQAMEESGFKIGRVVDVAGVRWFGPFARTYVADQTVGVPFLTSSTMLVASNLPEKFISTALTRDLERLMVSEGTILVSCSGTIGNVAVCTTNVDGFALSQDAIRVDAKQDIDRGLIYVLLLSPLGRFLVMRNKSGSVIEHLYAADIESLPLPVLPKRLRHEISAMIRQVCDLRVRANLALQEANRRITVLDNVGTDSAGVFPGNPSVASFVRRASDVHNAAEREGCARLDATYYAPGVQKLRNQLRAAAAFRLVDIAVKVILIGKTFVEGVNKVERDFGVPYFTGKELFKTRPLPETFITCRRKEVIDRLLVRRGTTLITCAGTVAKVMYVSGALDGSAVTHDAIRVIPGADMHPGYVYAYLASPGGQAQLSRCSYGSVIPRLYRTHVEEILIPRPNDQGVEIGQMVDNAFDLRDEALEIENVAVETFLRALKQGRSAVEQEWGEEY
ncbi:MAG: restriction endonuclease subunit [Herbaspirillum sp.]|nr:restriction endonuclease subunit [Herbaspirillum sp.]